MTMTIHHPLSSPLPFIETLRVSHGSIRLHHLHRQRMEATCREAYGCYRLPSPDTVEVPEEYRRGEVKLRLLYGRDHMEWEFQHYTRRDVTTLRLVEATPLPDYHLKYADRTALLRLHALRGDCDEILITHRGLPYDTTYTNILLTDGRRLVAPTSCLLPGVMRRHLIESGRAEALPLTVEALRPGNPYGFTHILLINAMMPPELAPRIPLTDIST